MKKKIIFIHFNKFLNEFDWKRYEFDILEKNYEIEVHELLNLNHKKLFLNYNKNSFLKNIKKFKNFKEWKNYFINQDKDSIFVIFQTMPYNFFSFKCYLFIKKIEFCCSVISINNLPNYYDKNYKTKNNIELKLMSVFFRPKQALLIIKNFLIFFIFLLFKKKLSPNFLFLGGNSLSSKKKFERYNKFTKIVKINSWDYSFFLRNNNILNLNQKYILYIGDGEARYPSDSSFINSKRVEDPKKYCENLNLFFNKIESFYKCEVIIASHPRSQLYNNIDIDLGSRKSFKGSTEELVRKCDFVISNGSTALSYAAIYFKPILFIYSKKDQSKNIPVMKKSEFFSKYLGCKRINIDNYNDFKNLNLKLDFNAYKDFIKNYVCSVEGKPNYKLISETIVNINFSKSYK